MALNSIRRLRDRVFGSLLQTQEPEPRRELTNEELKAQFSFSRKPRVLKKVPQHNEVDGDDVEERSVIHNHRMTHYNNENDTPTTGIVLKNKTAAILPAASSTIPHSDQTLTLEPGFTSKTSSETSDDTSEDSTPSSDLVSSTNTRHKASSSMIAGTMESQPTPRHNMQTYIRPRINYGNRQGLPPDDEAWEQYEQGLHPLSRDAGILSAAETLTTLADGVQETATTATGEELDALAAKLLAPDHIITTHNRLSVNEELDERLAQFPSPLRGEVKAMGDIALRELLESMPELDVSADLEELGFDITPNLPVTAFLQGHNGEDDIQAAASSLTNSLLSSTSPVAQAEVVTPQAIAVQVSEAISPLSLDQSANSTTKEPMFVTMIESTNKSVVTDIDHLLEEQHDEDEPAKASDDNRTSVGADQDVSLEYNGESFESNGVPIEVDTVSPGDTLAVEVDPEASNVSSETETTTRTGEENLPVLLDNAKSSYSAVEAAESSTEPSYFTRRTFRFNPYSTCSAKDDIVHTRKLETDGDLHPAYLKVKTDLHLPDLGQPYLSKSAKPVPQLEKSSPRPPAIYITPGERRKFVDGVHAELKRGGIVKL